MVLKDLVVGEAVGVRGLLCLGQSIMKDGDHPAPFAALYSKQGSRKSGISETIAL